ncbi:hypothetical protein ACIQGO_37150 [Streptomyces shenzhenensis]
MTELARSTGHPAPGRLVDQLLLLFEGATITQAAQLAEGSEDADAGMAR